MYYVICLKDLKNGGIKSEFSNRNKINININTPKINQAILGLQTHLNKMGYYKIKPILLYKRIVMLVKIMIKIRI